MKAIAGIYRFDGQAAGRDTVEMMLASMNRTNVRPTALWCDGPIALGGLLPKTEDTRQPSNYWPPAAISASSYHLVADARIDNRKELLQQLGLEGSQRPNYRYSDEEFILAAYGKWGADAAGHLIGDYAFALWDGSQHTLFCARDHFGLRPFYVYSCAQFFLFASELQAILAHPQVPRRINELRVSLHLALHVADNRITFYRDIERLLPAHSLTVNQGGTQAQKQHWSLANRGELQLPTDADFVEAFQEIFIEAVACRIPQQRSLGAFLSGGLDSTAVTCVARNLLYSGNYPPTSLQSFSAIFDQTPECDERSYITETVSLGGIYPHYVDVESSSPAAKIDQMVGVIGEPFPAPTLYILWRLYQEASRQGIRVILDGLDGDTAVHHGDAYLAELARTSQWPRFFQLASAIVRRKKLPSIDSLMQRYGDPYLASLASGWRWRQLHGELQALSGYSTISPRRLFYRYVLDHSLRPLANHTHSQVRAFLGKATPSSRGHLGLVSQRLLRQSGLVDYLEDRAQMEQAPATSRQEHYRQLTTPLLPQLFEISTRVARAFDIDARHPFTDRRLVEFCYGLPPQQKVADGWTRNIVRRALAGVIPEAVRWRGDKSQNSAAVTKAFLAKDAAHIEYMLNHNQNQLAEFVNISLLQHAYKRYCANGNEQDEMLIWQAITLSTWLEQNEALIEC